MFVNEKIHIKLKSLLFFVLLSSILFCQNYQKEIFPLQQNKIGVEKFSFEPFKRDTLLGIFQEFNSRGEKIPGTSFLAICYPNMNQEYEIIWRYNAPQKGFGDFTDFICGDIDNDKFLEVIAITSTKDKTLPPIIIFEHKGYELKKEAISLPEELSHISNLTSIEKSNKSQKEYFLLNDNFENDVFLLQFSKNEIQILDLWQSNSNQIYFESQLLSNEKDNYLIRVNSDKLQLIQLDSDSTKINLQEISEPNGNIWDIQNIDWADFNGDDEYELVIGKMNGGINLVSNVMDSAITTEIFNTTFQYDRFFISDIDNDKKQDLLIVDMDGRGIKSYSYGEHFETFWNSQLIVKTDMTGIHFLNMQKQDNLIYYTYLFPEFMHHGIIKLYSDHSISSEQQPEPESNTHYVNIFSIIDSLITNYSKIEGKPVKIQTPQKHEIIEIKSSRRVPPKSDYILEPDQKFIQKINLFSVSSENLNYTINAPEGMRFNLVDHSFIWQPTESQLGLHNIDAVFFWDDVEVKKEFSIYINDPIEIINKLPSRNIIQAGEIFQYQLDIKDRNSDNVVNYKMAKYPDGASINANGLILWKPEYHQNDWYDFDLTVSDGFSEDHLNFSIFVNHPVKAIDSKPINLTIGDNLNHKIQFEDNNKGYFLGQYNIPPKIEDWKNAGIYETVILTNETKLKLPAIIDDLATNNTIIQGTNFVIKEIFFDQNKLILHFNYNSVETPKFADIFAKFFEFINLPIPNHTSYIATQFYKLTLKDSPEGAYITNNGVIKWKPEIGNLGENKISYTVSDDFYSDENVLEVFVNDSPKIISSPQKYANMNELYQYQIKIEDRNQSDRFHFELKQSPENAKLSNNGILEWQVADRQQIDNFFQILVSDGRDTTYHDFHVQINQKPIVTSVSRLNAKTGRLLNHQVKAIDPEGSKLFYRAIEIPESANFDSNKGILFWKPGKNSVGNYNIVIEIKDEEGNVAFDKFSLQVQQSKINLKTLSIITTSAGLAALLMLLLV